MSYPQRVVSAWEMMKVNAGWFVNTLNTIGFCEGALEANSGLAESTSTLAVDQITGLLKQLPAASVPATIAALNMLKKHWTTPGGISKAKLRGLLQNVSTNLQAELEGRSLWLLSGDEQAIYRVRNHPFGESVFHAFPNMREDLEEAAICLATSRNTASVFHLMRAMEQCVVAMSHKLSGVAEQKVWGLLLGDIKTAIDGMSKGPERTAWSQTHALLFGVKEAWRNEVMHPKQAYTTEQALEVFHACRSFIRHLATQLAPPPPELAPPDIEI